MVTVNLKGLYIRPTKKRTYYYAWRGGPRLNTTFGTTEFLAEFAAATHAPTNRDTQRFETWVDAFETNADFKAFADTTRRVWTPWLKRIRKHFGELSVKQFDRPEIRVRIRKWRDGWRAQPRTADMAKQVLSRVLSYCVYEGVLSVNPCEGIPNLYDVDRSEIIWTDADLAHLCSKASLEVARVARLAALTGLRQADLLRLSWGNIGPLAIELPTSKSKGRRTATIPLTEPLRVLLAEIPRYATTVLTSSRKRPWRGFGASWTKAVATAWPEGRDLHFHDLRGTAATNFYRAGLTPQEVADIMGWSKVRVERILARYVHRDGVLRDLAERIAHGQRTETVKRSVKTTD